MLLTDVAEAHVTILSTHVRSRAEGIDFPASFYAANVTSLRTREYSCDRRCWIHSVTRGRTALSQVSAVSGASLAKSRL